MKLLAIIIAFLATMSFAYAQSQPVFDAPSAHRDSLVNTCLATEGVTYFENTKTICYNAAIFPEQFLKLNDLPAADQIVITSPGGNVATARLMSTILDRRGEPAIIAGQCMSACAMVLLPGLDSVQIHRTAHIAVHGITMMDYRTWWGWLRDGKTPSGMSAMAAQLGYDFEFALHHGGKSHMQEHLKGQNVDVGYIEAVNQRMQDDAVLHDCRVDPKDYWGMLDADHLQTYLGDRITHMEAFAQSWSDPNNRIYKAVTEPISDQTYIFADDLSEAVCP